MGDSEAGAETKYEAAPSNWLCINTLLQAAKEQRPKVTPDDSMPLNEGVQKGVAFVDLENILAIEAGVINI